MRLALTSAALLAVAALTGCQAEATDTTLVAFLAAGDARDRATDDEAVFAERVAQTCDGCEYIALDAGGDAGRQAQQMSVVLAEGADVVVLTAVDPEQAEELVVAAGSVPVVAYDRLVPGADYLVTFDARRTGRLLAERVRDALGGRGSVLVVHGARTDYAAGETRREVRRVLDRSRVRVLAELDPAGWSAAEARAWTADRLAELGADAVDAVVVATDQQAGGVLRAFAAAGVPAAGRPLVASGEADLAGLRRIIRGEQTSTVHRPYAATATRAADLAVTLVTGGRAVRATTVEGVPAFALVPAWLDLASLTNTVVRDGSYTTGELCDPATLARCEEIGIR